MTEEQEPIGLTINHFCHPEHLLLLTYKPTYFQCNFCETISTDLRYQCNKCDFAVYENCITYFEVLFLCLFMEETPGKSLSFDQLSLYMW
jgi:C1 domain